MFIKILFGVSIAMALFVGATNAAPSFSSYDQNGDGIMTVDEYDSFILAPFERIDTNSDARISPAEAIIVARERAKGTNKKPRRMVTRLFERFDNNEDQFLTMLELGYGGAGEFFNHYDANYDGEISLSEWEEVTLADAQVSDEPEPETNEETATEAPSETTSGERERVPTEPSEPDNINSDKVLPGNVIATPSPLTGSWLFDFSR